MSSPTPAQDALAAPIEGERASGPETAPQTAVRSRPVRGRRGSVVVDVDGSPVRLCGVSDAAVSPEVQRAVAALVRAARQRYEHDVEAEPPEAPEPAA